MDSCNSGSIQSLSSGDEEYDSKYGGSISTFLNSSTPFDLLSSSPLPQFLSPNFTSNNILDSPNSPYYNNDLTSLRSDPIFNNFGNFTHQGPYHDFTLTTTKSSNIDKPNHAMKKKRRRATRRAPTTVLTTDATNFRQMVQEFTGIPTTPFTGSAYTRRLDLFSSTASSAIRSANLDNFGQLFQNMTPSTLVMPINDIASGTSATNTSIPCLDELGMCHEQVSATFCNSHDVGGYM